jgi:uncharacterized membrane protein YfcA
MTELFIELIVVGILIGVMSGFFGIGGGMILVPILLFLGFEIKEAIGISIIQMVFSSILGSYLNYKKGSLILGEGLYVGFGGFIGGFIGGYVTGYMPSTLLEYLFLGLLLFALFRLIFSKNTDDVECTREISSLLLFSIGVVVGVFSITLGVGGAIIITPLLVGVLHYPIKKAVSAGLFFVVFSSVAGLASRLTTGTIELNNGLVVAIASLFGVSLGIALKDYVKPKNHKMALLMLYIVAFTIIAHKLWSTN